MAKEDQKLEKLCPIDDSGCVEKLYRQGLNMYHYRQRGHLDQRGFEIHEVCLESVARQSQRARSIPKSSFHVLACEIEA